MAQKPHLEIHRLDMPEGWEMPSGHRAGTQPKILAGALDDGGRSGAYHGPFNAEGGGLSLEFHAF